MRIRRTQKRLAKASVHSDLSRVIGQGDALRPKWSGLNLSRQTTTVKAVVDHVTILAGTPGARTLDPSRVIPAWRL